MEQGSNGMPKWWRAKPGRCFHPPRFPDDPAPTPRLAGDSGMDCADRVIDGPSPRGVFSQTCPNSHRRRSAPGRAVGRETATGRSLRARVVSRQRGVPGGIARGATSENTPFRPRPGRANVVLSGPEPAGREGPTRGADPRPAREVLKGRNSPARGKRVRERSPG